MSKLSNRQLNNLLRDELDSIKVPDVKQNAKQFSINTSQSTQKTSKGVNKKMVFTAFAMCCAIVLCTCLGIFLPMQNNGGGGVVANNISYVTIDINPSITIKLNNNKVEDVTHNNKDGGIVLAGVDKNDIVGKDAKYAIDKVLTSCAISGYLAYDDPDKEKQSNAVKVGVIGDNGLDNEQLANDVESDVTEFFRDRNLFALVVKDTAIKEQNDKTLEKFGITYSKFNLIKSVYQIEYKKLIVKDDDKNLENFVNDNKDERVSELYKRLLKVDSFNFDSIYKAIYDIIKNPTEFNNYVSENLNKVNDKLDEFIKNQLASSDIIKLIEQKSEIIENDIKNAFSLENIIELVKVVKSSIKDAVEQGSDEFGLLLNDTLSWLASLSGIDTDGIFDIIDKEENTNNYIFI